MTKTFSGIQNIAFLSTHGHFDPVPQLGRTDTGGQVVYVLELAKALSALRINVDIFTRWFDRTQKQVNPVPDWPGVRIIRIPAGPWAFIPKEEIYDVLDGLAENMIAFIKKQGFGYDLFHGHYVDAGIVTLRVARHMEKPSFFTPHSLGAWKRDQMKGDPDEMEKKYRFKRRISEERRIFRSVDGLAVTSLVQHEKLEALYGFTSDNIVNLPPGTNIHQYRPSRPDEEDVHTDLPKPYVLCLSRIDSNKGHDLLLEAFDIVRNRMPDFHLVIGGGSARPQQRELEILDNIKNIIRQKHLEEAAHVIGYVPDKMMVPYYRQAELFVLPSTFEPFGMTAAEAMACGTPVIASKHGGIRNVIVSGKNGLLIDPANPQEFAEAILSLLDDKKRALSMGLLGCETIRREYSWEAMAERHIAFYRRFMTT